MAASYDQQINALQAKLSAYKSIEVPRAAASALNKSGALARTRVIKGVATAINVPQKHVRKRMYIKRATAKHLGARLRTYYRGISVIDLNAKDSGKGGWKTRKGRGVRAGKRRYTDAFIARGSKGHQHVFQRTGSQRLPLEVVRIEIQTEIDAIAPKVSERVVKSDLKRLLVNDLKWRLKKYEV